jgi:type I restriction enzyme S subunit
MNQLGKPHGALGVSNYDGIISPAYFVANIASSAEPRFIHHLLRTRLYISEYERRGKFMPPSQFDISWEDFRSIPVAMPPITTQRSIADYLDRETARIDALIAAKRRMAELLEERWQGFLEAEIRGLADKYGEIPLKYVCREVVVGIVITPSAWYTESGIPAIRGTNVSPGTISSDDLVYLTEEGHKLHPKSQLRSGDVVVVRTGQAGAAAVVPPELDGINCIDLVIIRLRSNYSAHFLEFVMNSDWMQKHIVERSVGTIQSHFNVGAAGVIPVPRAPFTDQDAMVDRLRREQRRVSGLASVVERQVELLQERRQALVTAAVTGHLGIPEAA